MTYSSNSQAELRRFLERQDQNPWPNYNGYTKLDQSRKEIRVLKVWFPPGTEELHGRLEPVDLATYPQYEALSYYWGPPDEQRPIVFEGETVLVAKNLHSFLSALCSSEQALPVWADALCINQADVEERNWQVAMMGDIYSHAVRVKAWIGDADADSNFALDYVNYLTSNSHSVHTSHSALKTRARQAFGVFISRPYWERMWVIQEIALASELLVLSGSRLVPWTNFVTVLKDILGKARSMEEYTILDSLQTKDSRSDRQNGDLARVERLDSIRSTRQVSSLLKVAAQFADNLCTDPRDKIYALLGVAKRMAGHSLTVDYQKSILDVYFDLLFYTLNTEPVGHQKRADDGIQVMRGLRSSTQASSWSLVGLINTARRLPFCDLRYVKEPSPAQDQRTTESLHSLWNWSTHKDVLNACPFEASKLVYRPRFEACLGASVLPKRLDPRISMRDELGVLDTIFVPKIVIRSEPSNHCFNPVGILHEPDLERLRHWQPDRNDFRMGANKPNIYRYGIEICKHADLRSDGGISILYVHVSHAVLLHELLGGQDSWSSNREWSFFRQLEAAMRDRAISGPDLCNCEEVLDRDASAGGESAVQFLRKRDLERTRRIAEEDRRR